MTSSSFKLEEAKRPKNKTSEPDLRDSGIGMTTTSSTTGGAISLSTTNPGGPATNPQTTEAAAAMSQPTTEAAATIMRSPTTSTPVVTTAPPSTLAVSTAQMPPTCLGAMSKTTSVTVMSQNSPMMSTGFTNNAAMPQAPTMGQMGSQPPTPMPPMGMNPQYLGYLQALAQMQQQFQQFQQPAPGAGGIGTGTMGQGAGTAAMPPPTMFGTNTPMNLTLTESKIGIKIPIFYGDGSDGGKTTAYKFREMVERAQTLNRWSDKDTAEMAISNMAGDADEWADRMVRSNRPEERIIMEKWSTMRPEFMKRFDVMPTPTQKIAKISNISQYPKETAKRYYDRLREALDYIGKETLMNPPVMGTWEEGFLAASDVIFQTFYLRGLDPRIRLQVQAQLGKGCTLEALVEKANEVDELLKEEKQAGSKALQMAPMHVQEIKAPGIDQETKTMVENKIKQELGMMSAQMAAMHAGKGKQQRASPNEHPSRKVAEVPMKERGWLLCYKCRQYGQHLSSECQLEEDQVKQLTRMTKKDRPQGKAHDAQFNTRQD